MRVSVYLAASVDGFIAREDGDIAWLHELESPGEGVDYGYADFMATVDTLVMGRNTFEKVLTFGEWPYTKPVVVLSSRPVEIPAAIADRVDSSSLGPDQLVDSLLKQGRRHLYIDGGATVRGFLAAGLVDELTISWIPRLLGRGIPLFDGDGPGVRLTLVESTPYPNGIVQSRYEVDRRPARG